MADRKRKPMSKSAKRAQSRKVDEQVEETFPASDPPSFMGGKQFVGAPPKRETPAPDCAKRKK